MSDTNDTVSRLQQLHLTVDEAKIYLELLRMPSTHLQVSRATGVNRTKVYRVTEQLEKRSLISRRTDDRGTFLVAADPLTLEVALVNQEENLNRQREALQSLLPTLSRLQGQDSRGFIVRTYEGQAGLKQMCWHELRAKGELLALGNGSVEQITSDARWANRYRRRQMVANYTIREIVNYDNGYTQPALTDQKNMDSGVYSYRILSPDILTFDNQTIVYDDIVAIYHWKHDQKVGVEIISRTYADMMRQVFGHYWRLAGKTHITDNPLLISL